MSDLINRQAAIDSICSVCEVEKPKTCSTIQNGDRWCKEVHNLLNLPSVQPEQKWISCSKRLPEFDVKVLAYVKNKDPEGRFNKDGIYIAELEDKVPMHDPEGKKNIWGIPGYESEWTVWAWSYFTEPNVLAWMPLPEPYEVEK